MHRFALAASLLFTTACADQLVAVDGGADAEVAYRGTSAEDDALVLRAANELSFEELDVDAALDRRAAENIVSLRPFDTLEALDEVAYVGPSALNKLYDIAVERFGTGGLSAAQEEALVLYAANTLDFETLDDVVALDRRAAENIVDERPFDTLEALDAVSYVGPSALDKLLDYAFGTWGDTPPELCPEGLIVSSTGGEYTSLHEAIRRAPDGTELTLCGGSYSLDPIDVETDIVLRGQGPGITRLAGWSERDMEIIGAEVTLADLSIEGGNGGGYGVLWATWDSVVTLDHVHVIGVASTAIYAYRADVVLTGGTRFEDLGNGIWLRYADIDSTGSVFQDIDGFAVYIDSGDGSFVEDTFHRVDGSNGAVYISTPWAHTGYLTTFSDVDFGVGTTDNAVHDLHTKSTNSFGGTSGSTFDDLISHESLTCTWGGCSRD